MNATMRRELLDLMSERSGHFRLESGHHGHLWLDLDALFQRPNRLRPFVDAFAARLAGFGVEVVCGPLIGGALLAQTIAAVLDVEFAFAERLLATDRAGIGRASYRIPSGLRHAVSGKAIAVIDDVVNAGSAIRATIADLRDCGARPVVVGALLVLGDAASAYCTSKNLPLVRLADRPNDLWEPSACPLCAAGVPIDDVASRTPSR